MKDIHQVIESLPSEVYERMRSAVELGKWEDGSVLSEQQRESCLQVVMLYQARHLNQQEHFTINARGTINELSKAELKKQFRGETPFRGETIAEFKVADL